MEVSEQHHAVEGLTGDKNYVAFQGGKGHILTQVRNKMEIPVKDYIQEDCFTCRLNERYENGGATMDTPSGALWLLTH